MTRRALIGRLFRREQERVCKPPETEAQWNHFAQRGNRFVESLNRGVVDMRLWKQTVDAWRQMTE